MYGITGKHSADNDEQDVQVFTAHTWTEAHEKAQQARDLDWPGVEVVPGYENTCHSPLGYSPDTPVCALVRGHGGGWHEAGSLSWYDDEPASLSVALDEQQARDCRTPAES